MRQEAVSIKEAVVKHFFPIGYLLVIYFGVLARLHFARGVQILKFPSDIPWILSGAVEIAALSFILSLLVGDNLFLRALTTSIFALLYSILGFYHLRSSYSFDFSAAVSNIHEIFFPGSFRSIIGHFKTKDIIATGILTLIPWVILFLSPQKFKADLRKKAKRVALLTALLIWPISVSITDINYNELSKFIKSGKNYYFPPNSRFLPSPDEIQSELSGYIHPDVFKRPRGLERLDIENVFIVLMESFNGNYVGKRDESGREFTPYFNELTKQGIYFPNFFSGSVQTAKGHFATLFSRHPHTKYLETVKLKNLRMPSLPGLLKDRGFRTFAFQAMADGAFDNMENFFTRNGVENFISMDGTFISKADEPYVWGWGLQDDKFYEKSIDYLAAHNQKTRIFATFATETNHLWFDWVPVELRYFFKTPRGIEQCFANSIYLMDMFLRTFIRKLSENGYLENSAIFLLGDHGFPMGEHGNYAQENTSFNENFKIPLLILLPGQEMKKVDERVASQLDIAPTVLDLLDLGMTDNSFQGKSIFLDEDRPAVMIQPYGGGEIAVIDKKLKFVYKISMDRSFLYDLGLDPNQTQDISNKRNSDYYKILKTVFLNDALLEALSKRD